MILSESHKGTTGLICKFEIPVSGRDGQGRATHARKKKTRHPLWGCRDVRAREHRLAPVNIFLLTEMPILRSRA